MYFVLYKDDFGEKKIARFETYADAIEFYTSNVVFPYYLLTEQRIWDYCTSQRHE